jgi:hypothetical protein
LRFHRDGVFDIPVFRGIEWLRRDLWFLCFSSLLVFGAQGDQDHWTPPVQLERVPVRQDCTKTHGRIGIAFQPTIFNPHGAIFLCPERAQAIDSAHPGAAFFFRVHEYGHLALHTRNEALADAWAAEELSHSSAGQTTLRSAFAYFTDLGEQFALMYGSGYDRALTVAESGHISQADWPLALIDYRRHLNERRARNGSIRPAMSDQIADGLLWIDDQLVGFVSTAHGYVNPPVPDLSGSAHRLLLHDVWISEIDSPNRLVAKGLEASVQFVGKNSPEGLRVDLRYQGESLTVFLPK